MKKMVIRFCGFSFLFANILCAADETLDDALIDCASILESLFSHQTEEQRSSTHLHVNKRATTKAKERNSTPSLNASRPLQNKISKKRVTDKNNIKDQLANFIRHKIRTNELKTFPSLLALVRTFREELYPDSDDAFFYNLLKVMREEKGFLSAKEKLKIEQLRSRKGRKKIIPRDSEPRGIVERLQERPRFRNAVKRYSGT